MRTALIVIIFSACFYSPSLLIYFLQFVVNSCIPNFPLGAPNSFPGIIGGSQLGEYPRVRGVWPPFRNPEAINFLLLTSKGIYHMTTLLQLIDPAQRGLGCLREAPSLPGSGESSSTCASNHLAEPSMHSTAMSHDHRSCILVHEDIGGGACVWVNVS